jgi:hypothetical protein
MKHPSTEPFMEYNQYTPLFLDRKAQESHRRSVHLDEQPVVDIEFIYIVQTLGLVFFYQNLHKI